MLYIITEYFHPFSDAGGPIRSIENIINNFAAESNICILTSSSDYNNNPLPKDYIVNTIFSDKFTGHKIAYVSKYLTGLFFLFRSVKRNDIVYINGLFKPSLNLIPILISNKLIISPRGMLQYNLLKQKSLVKQLYLRLLKFIFLFKNVQWHATTKQEALEIINVFGKKTNIKVISNVPVRPFTVTKNHVKHPQALLLVYYGLIVENKGLLSLIQTLKNLNYPVSLDIYGSVKDKAYWKLCQQQINENNSLASFYYKGHANPADSQTILASYDALVLLTKGENFGHSIYEALSVGTPVIISDKTPWVFEKSATPAGWLVDYANNEFDTHRLKQVLVSLYNMDNNTYSLCTANSNKYALDFYNSHDFKTQYEQLFNLSSNEN
jgi:glycosyltransferase involved in cell wall biosynthesis